MYKEREIKKTKDMEKRVYIYMQRSVLQVRKVGLE